MLVEFRFSNFRSFRDEARLTALSKRVSSRCFQGRVLPVLAVYGANASGKSNLFRALGWMRQFVLNCGKNNSTDQIDVDPFLYAGRCQDEPMNFEIKVLIGGRLYRFGFSVTRRQVVDEWLYTSSGFGGEERRVYQRTTEGIRGGAALKRFERTVLPNTLLLSRLDQENRPMARLIMRWMWRLAGLQGVELDGLYPYSARKFMSGNAAVHARVLEFLRRADPTIIDTSVKTDDVSADSRMAADRRRTVTKTLILRKSQDLEDLLIGTEFSTRESAGTCKMFMLSGPVTDVLDRGGVLAMDELESQLHPLLVDYVVGLFKDPKTNPHQAQLIFTTHDVELMSRADLSPEQIYMCSKKLNCESTVYALSDFPKVRKVDDLGERYVRGDFGGIPYFHDYAWLYRRFANRADRRIEEEP